MTNENKSDFKSYYPHINVTDYLSERDKKMLHDSMVREHEYAEALRREAGVYGNEHASCGVTCNARNVF